MHSDHMWSSQWSRQNTSEQRDISSTVILELLHRQLAFWNLILEIILELALHTNNTITIFLATKYQWIKLTQAQIEQHLLLANYKQRKNSEKALSGVSDSVKYQRRSMERRGGVEEGVRKQIKLWGGLRRFWFHILSFNFFLALAVVVNLWYYLFFRWYPVMIL